MICYLVWLTIAAYNQRLTAKVQMRASPAIYSTCLLAEACDSMHTLSERMLASSNKSDTDLGKPLVFVMNWGWGLSPPSVVVYVSPQGAQFDPEKNKQGQIWQGIISRLCFWHGVFVHCTVAYFNNRRIRVQSITRYFSSLQLQHKLPTTLPYSLCLLTSWGSKLWYTQARCMRSTSDWKALRDVEQLLNKLPIYKTTWAPKSGVFSWPLRLQKSTFKTPHAYLKHYTES